MSHFCTNRFPRAHIDRLDSEREALALLSLTITYPLTDEVIAVLLDSERRGHGIVIVNEPPDADGIFDVIDRLTTLTAESGRSDEIHGVILASCRARGGLEPRDAERWMEANELCAAASLELVEWFVVGDRLACPRDLIGEPPRWGSP